MLDVGRSAFAFMFQNFSLAPGVHRGERLPFYPALVL